MEDLSKLTLKELCDKLEEYKAQLKAEADNKECRKCYYAFKKEINDRMKKK